MAKKMNLMGIAFGLVAIATTIAVGGLFLDGTTLLDNPLLKFLPEIVHQIVGWAVIGLGILSGIKLFGLKI